MIEMIYDSETSNEEKSESRLKMPKNVRQIGYCGKDKRIYVEDYVITYLNQMSRPGNGYARGAILLGECKKTSNEEILFISGAIEAQNIELDLNKTSFDHQTWSEIYQTIKKNFEDLEVVGWFLSRMGFSVDLTEKMEQLHKENFAGEEKVLYVIDSLENEDAFYMWENEKLVKQTGYFIYYERNENMQRYMISRGTNQYNQEAVTKKDGELIRNYRETMSYKREKAKKAKRGDLFYAASGMLALFTLAMGITVLNNYDKMKSMEKSIDKVSLMLESETSEGDSKPVVIIDDQGTVKKEETSEENTLTDADQLEDAISSANASSIYIVEDGDTLTAISNKMYHSPSHIKEIADANGMEETDKIYVGEKIIIPSLD